MSSLAIFETKEVMRLDSEENHIICLPALKDAPLITRDKRLLLGALLSAIALAALCLPFGASQAIRPPSLLTRVINVEEYGLLTYNDTFMISRFDLETSEENLTFTFTVPKDYVERMVTVPEPFTFSLSGSSGDSLFTVSNVSGSLVVSSSRSSLLGQVIGDYVNFSLAYRFLIKPEQFSWSLKNLTFPLKFSATFPARLFSVNITVPLGNLFSTPPFFERQDLAGRTVVYTPYASEEAQSFATLSLILNSYITPFTISHVYLTISLDPLLGLSAEEGFAVRSDPLNPQSTVPWFPITDQATDIWARDVIGPIASQVTVVPNSSVKAVLIEPRIELGNGGNYTFFICYKLPMSNFTNRDGDLVTIKHPTSWNYTLFVYDYVLTVNLPTGGEIESISIAGGKLDNIEYPSPGVARVQLRNLPMDVLGSDLVIAINYPLLWAGYTPSVFVFVVGATLLGAYYAVLRKPAKPEKPEAEPSAELASEVSRSIKRSMALFSQIQELELRYFEGDIHRREFKGLHQKLRSDLERALPGVRDASRKLSGTSSYYAGKLRNYESLWAELQAKHASQREVGFGYLNKKISRATYSELADRYSREISVTLAKIRSLLEEFPAS